MENKEKLIDRYKDCYSVSTLMGEFHLSRGEIVSILKEENVYEGLKGPNYLRKRSEDFRKIMYDKYGVINPGQLPHGGYGSSNKLPRDDIPYLMTEYQDYRKAVDNYIKNYVRRRKRNNSFPTHCYYTGIRFKDEEVDSVNPNDLRKRSVDHKIPVVIGYLNGLSIEEINAEENIIFVLKYVNSIKGNIAHESFTPLAEKIRKVFINEGYESQEIRREVYPI